MNDYQTQASMSQRPNLPTAIDPRSVGAARIPQVHHWSGELLSSAEHLRQQLDELEERLNPHVLRAIPQSQIACDKNGVEPQTPLVGSADQLRTIHSVLLSCQLMVQSIQERLEV